MHTQPDILTEAVEDQLTTFTLNDTSTRFIRRKNSEYFGDNNACFDDKQCA